jgi:NADH:ubiquinone oxidoreductase subunit C
MSDQPATPKEPAEPTEPAIPDAPTAPGIPAAPDASAASESPAAPAAPHAPAAPEEPSPVGWLPRPAAQIFGEGATAEEAYDLLTVDVPAEAWLPALTAARDDLGCTYFDWLSAVDEPGTGFRVCVHLAALDAPVRRLLVRTTVAHEAPALPTAIGVYAGAAWHERETHEMFGVDFTVDGAPLQLEPLLLPENFEGHPLRKDFILASRVAKPFPGAKEPGEAGDVAHDSSPARRRTRPPGVPEPEQWGPREPGTDKPDTLGAAAAGPATPRPRRTPRARPAAESDGPSASGDSPDG